MSWSSNSAEETEIWVPAMEMGVVATAAISALTTAGVGIPVFTFSDAATASVGGVVDLPDDWTTFDLDLWWLAYGAPTGDIVWRAYLQELGTGVDATTLVSQGNVTATSGAQNISVKTTVVSGATHTDTKFTSYQLMRRGSEVADTLAGTIGLVGAMFRKAS